MKSILEPAELGRGRAARPSAGFGGPAHTQALRPSPHPSGPRATCVLVSCPVGQHNSGNASQGLLAGQGAGIMNSSPLVGREVGGRTLAGHACVTQNHY